MVLIILLPMMITGSLSAAWITKRINASVAQWLRESARLDSDTLAELHKNARLFATVLLQYRQGKLAMQAGRSPVPQKLLPLAQELGISLVQVYAENGKRLYSSQPVRLMAPWPVEQDSAVVKVNRDGRSLLASINVLRVASGHGTKYRLVVGSLFDQALLSRLSRGSGLKTRLYYANDGHFSNVFAKHEKPLRLQLPAAAFARLLRKQDYFSADSDQGRYWGLYSPVLDTSGRLEAILFSGQQRIGSDRLLSDQGQLTLVIFVVGVVLAVVTGLVLARFVVRPVKQLHQGVQRVAAQDFRARIPVATQDELGELAQAFNAMADSLHQARDEQQREFQRDKLSALGELALAMAHETRNPIGTIMTASGLLQQEHDKAKQGQLREAIHEASRRLDRLLNDFQQLARHQAPQQVTLDPAEPLEKILAQMVAGRNNVILTRHYRHGTFTIQADPDLLQQAWANVCRNALEAMGEQGGELEAGSVVEADAVLIYLHDSGPGIPLAQVTRLFEPFYTNKTQGSGLGLTIAASLVEANGGILEYVPGSWRGARFAMRFGMLATKDD